MILERTGKENPVSLAGRQLDHPITEVPIDEFLLLPTNLQYADFSLLRPHRPPGSPLRRLHDALVEKVANAYVISDNFVPILIPEDYDLSWKLQWIFLVPGP